MGCGEIRCGLDGKYLRGKQKSNERDQNPFFHRKNLSAKIHFRLFLF